MEKGYVKTPDGQVHYRAMGNGQPLVMLHQTPHYDDFLFMLPELGKSCRAIAMDTLGYGGSDLPTREFEITDYARNVAAFLDGLGIKKANLLGHHTGASIAVEVAAAYPERVDRLVLSGCATWPPETWEKLLHTLASPEKQILEDGAFLSQAWSTYKALGPTLDPELRLRAVLCSLTARLNNPWDAHRAVSRYDIKGRLPKIKAPTLLLSGSRDSFINDLEATCRLIPDCRTGVIADAGAMIGLEKPVEMSAAILAFLRH
jgi:pimeloyl-ACP methyl ester carboxylesterase